VPTSSTPNQSAIASYVGSQDRCEPPFQTALTRIAHRSFPMTFYTEYRQRCRNDARAAGQLTDRTIEMSVRGNLDRIQRSLSTRFDLSFGTYLCIALSDSPSQNPS
jgi:hypothetical protein